MNSLMRSPVTWICAALVLMPLLASCAPDANAEIISPNLGPIEVAKIQGNQVEVVVEEAPPTLADLSDEEIYAGLPDAIAAAIPNADLANAENLRLSRGCSGCHSLDPDQVMTGPTWYNVGNRAVERAIAAGNAGPADYLYTSIHDPNAYVVPDYPANVMPQNYADQLSDQEFADLVAFLLSQRQES